MSSGWLNAKGPEGAQLKIFGISFNAVRPPPAAHYWDHQLGATLLKWATTAQSCNSQEGLCFNWQAKRSEVLSNKGFWAMDSRCRNRWLMKVLSVDIKPLGAPKWGIIIEAQAHILILIIYCILFCGGRSTQIVYISKSINTTLNYTSEHSAFTYLSKSDSSKM